MGLRPMDEGRGTREEGRGMMGEGRGKRDEGRWAMEEGRWDERMPKEKLRRKNWVGWLIK